MVHSSCFKLSSIFPFFFFSSLLVSSRCLHASFSFFGQKKLQVRRVESSRLKNLKLVFLKREHDKMALLTQRSQFSASVVEKNMRQATTEKKFRFKVLLIFDGGGGDGETRRWDDLNRQKLTRRQLKEQEQEQKMARTTINLLFKRASIRRHWLDGRTDKWNHVSFQTSSAKPKTSQASPAHHHLHS